MSYRDLAPEEAHAEIEADASIRLLDVRTPFEFDRHRLRGAMLLPIQEIAERLDELDRDANWFVYCEHGRRSVAVCEFLQQNGFPNVTNVRGGMALWIGSGLPCERGPAGR
ncbi:MAG TPA: rhodanese-like domain-containing protein [bacterium]|nr:rhodanese-like domain-containing protein [bacterium]